MFFRLSLKNMKKSFKDYAIYFLTLILGVAIFYIFNSLDSQQAMSVLGSSTYEIIDFMIQMLGGVSVLVSFILGFLIVYANNFLIRRRKKEFGIYMTLGMGKMQISRILLGETFLIGLLSLAVGLLIGIFGAQFMSLLVVRMFNGVMDGYQFVFSMKAFWKTILYFGILFLIVAVFNLISLSRYSLAGLLSAGKKNEKIRMKNPVLCVLIFLLAAADLIFQYYQVSHPETLTTGKILLIILAGCVGTFLFFWSLSGFLLQIFQKSRKYYFKDLNAFILRQIHSKVNTMVFSMTIICLMLFLTICVLGGGLGINFSFQKMLRELTPVDVNFTDLSGEKVSTKLEEKGFDLSLLKEGYVEVSFYSSPDLTMRDTMDRTGLDAEASGLAANLAGNENQETIMKESEYNRLVALYGMEPVEVDEDTYAIVSDYEVTDELRNQLLEAGKTISLNGKTYRPVYESCVYGFTQMMANHGNTGIFILADDQVREEWKGSSFLAADYQADTQKEKEQTDREVMKYDVANMSDGFLINTKIDIIAVSGGLSAAVTFISIYLGIIFLICSAAILALKELSESSDNKDRYAMLRKLGADEKMISRALFGQIGIFFFIPLLLAAVHSVFGMIFIKIGLQSIGRIDYFSSVLAAAVIFILIYGAYFLLTYFGSKRIIRNP
ncbi:MAG TPA: ABC transporter permease [Candidatus Blautia merdigallinarum]|uniref:ABC transporter permease n=1 Tax=Candidatus Blautia merdigallinarum TaxID=2838495 RepID=A0A9D2N943_9FIRM|nr:ABC transporter permease [Candidatus Blautia merdigallinarum]